jgi:hypothetical protein
MRIRVFFPVSGHRVEFACRHVVGLTSFEAGVATLLIWDADGSAALFDPRVWVTDTQGTVLYKPSFQAGLPKWARKWLAAHPGWCRQPPVGQALRPPMRRREYRRGLCRWRSADDGR